MIGTVVVYNGNYFLLWNINKANKAQLITGEGKKYSGTPSIEKVKSVKQLPVVEYNNGKYVIDKHERIFSMRTGNEVYKNGEERTKILAKV